MALPVAHRRHLQDLVECAVCMDISQDPRRLPCGHSFCFSCLQGLWKSSQPTSKVRCPQCRKDHWLGYEGPSSIPKDFIIEQIKEMLQTLPSSPIKSPGVKSSPGFPSSPLKSPGVKSSPGLPSSPIKSPGVKSSPGLPSSPGVKSSPGSNQWPNQSPDHPGDPPIPQRPSRCEFCLETFPLTAQYMYCLECDSLICKRCSCQHQCSRRAQKAVIKLDFECSLVCPDHHYPVRFICDDCNRHLCKRCQMQGVCGPHHLFDLFLGFLIVEPPSVAKRQLRKQRSIERTQSERSRRSPLVAKQSLKDPNDPLSRSQELIQKGKPQDPNITVTKLSNSRLRPPTTLSQAGMVNVLPEVTCIVTKSTTSPPLPILKTQQALKPPRPASLPPHKPQGPAIISPSPAEEQRRLPWHKNLSCRGRSVAILPSGDLAILTEKCVYLVDSEGQEVDSFSGVEDPWGVALWEGSGELVVSERKQRRLSVFTLATKKGSPTLRHCRYLKVNARAAATGLLHIFRSPDAGPMAVAALSDGGLVVTTARISGESVSHLNEVLVFNATGREQHRWQCEPAPQGVASINSYVLLSMRNCVKMFTPEGSIVQEFGDKRLLFDPGCLCPYSSQEVLVAHRKSYICDNVSVWRVSKWNVEGQRHGHLVEMSEVEHGPLMGVVANENLLVTISEKSVFCQDIKKLYLKRF